MMPSLPKKDRKRIELRGEHFTVIKSEFIEIIALKMSLDCRDFKSALRWVYKHTDGFIANLNGITQEEFERYSSLAEWKSSELVSISRNEQKRRLKELLSEGTE
jgi:hypothetical protein